MFFCVELACHAWSCCFWPPPPRRGGAAVVVRHHTAVAVVVMENSKMYSPTASRTLVGQQSKHTVERMINISLEIFIRVSELYFYESIFKKL